MLSVFLRGLLPGRWWREGLLGAYLSTLGLTFTNPSTILSFVAIFAGLGLGSSGSDYASAGVLVAGVFNGSARLACGG